MASSPLDLVNSDGFRKKLITRNLAPYAKSPNVPSPPYNIEYFQSDTSVQDSPDQLIDTPSFANYLYPLNQWGNEGGYEQVPDPNALSNTKSNNGPYGPGQQDARILSQAGPESDNWKKVNAYSNGTLELSDAGEFFTQPSYIRNGLDSVYNNQPYPTFNPSTYRPSSILLSNDPVGSDGLLSQDSFIAKLGAVTLRNQFQERIADQIRQDTIGRANVFNVRSGTDVLNIITGIVPLLEPNYTITVPSNPILAATDFALRLAGSILPVSEIPGSYFNTNINPGQPTTLTQLNTAFKMSAVGKFFTTLLGGGQTGSQIFYNNTGGGQKSRLFANIDYNKYKPSFDRTLFDRLAGAIVGSTTNTGEYYIGSLSSDPSRVFSPGGDVPVNSIGQEQQSPVYGPQELAQLYEGPSKDVRLGANGPTYSNGGGVEGGFTWVSPKYQNNAGFKVGVGGLITNQDPNFRPSSYVSTESTQRTFREGSILDDTQRIIDSQPQGGRRLQHVGNAIDQVSKVFNDGYKELTKGSRVLSYVGAIGQEVGTEYCRVFAKDVPYLEYNNLQKTDGITISGRRFADSVLDRTFNLNIAPNKQEGGQSSTNLIGTTNSAYAKKYMFSLENLAWRTSNTPGFSVSDLPVCERGPNGGRVMWFPPYALTFTENVSANWNNTDFIGRPEPVYTYKSTSRSGNLTWKMVVDHPSVLNVIVNKVLGNETNKVRINGILDSFFAGCRKYDIYELAKKYYMIKPDDLYQLQQAITSKDMTLEQIDVAKQTIQTGDKTTSKENQPVAQVGGGGNSKDYFNKYVNTGLYFNNDYPKKGGSIDYTSLYTEYTGQKSLYADKTPSPGSTDEFFDSVVTPNYNVISALATDLATQLKQYTGNITIEIDASASAPASLSYNVDLSQRRIDSLIEFFTQNESTKQFVTNKRISFTTTKALGESTTSQPMATTDKTNTLVLSPKGIVNCTDQDPNVKGGDIMVGAKEIYTYGAMACRRAFIKSINSSLNAPPSEVPPNKVEVKVQNVVTHTVKTEEITQEYRKRDNITKRIVRLLLSECDYFESIKETTPMVYDNLRDKLKFFQPAFHSTTPEGLNSRLTFLQQCMRPGDTIPTVKDIGGSPVLQYNNATNTSFGTPPVLILRIGDFYNTKIIPTSLNFTYEELDLNPEGIGVQPMIANVTMSFHFVGGSGLKESVDKLQNALTFNYYANTEIYDERSDATSQEENLKTLDSYFLSLASPPPVPGGNNTMTNTGQNNNNTIGLLSNTIVTATDETGTINYREFMQKFVTDTQTYFTNVINKPKEVVSQYNNALRQQWMLERSYTQGNFNVGVTLDPVVLFGKPNNVDKRIDQIFVKYQTDIQSSTDEFIKFISTPQKNFSPRLISTVKDNYSNFVKNKRSAYQNAITKITQDLVNIEQSYIQTLSRVNIISFDGATNTGTDGFQAKSGPVRVFVTKGTTKVSVNPGTATDTLTELKNDILKVQTDINVFNDIIWSKSSFSVPGVKPDYTGVMVFETGQDGISKEITVEEVFTPFSRNTEFTSFSFRRSYMIMSDDILDDKKYQTFKTAIIGNILGNTAIIGNGFDDLETAFDAYWLKTAKPIFTQENDITKSFINNLEKDKLKNFLIYTPFDNKDRELTYTTVNAAVAEKQTSQKNMISGLAATTNYNTNNNTWNDLNGNSTGAFISKAKLN